MRILLDCHEVLADFTGAALKIHGYSRKEFEALPSYIPGAWDLVRQLGLSDEDFWYPINRAGEGFWRDLLMLPEAPYLIHWLDTQRLSLIEEWYIVSSPSQHTSSYAGIRAWVQEHLGMDWNRLVLTNHKHLLANPDTILIDDSESNTAQFERAGGNAILYPAWCNHLHACDDPLGYTLKNLDHSLKC